MIISLHLWTHTQADKNAWKVCNYNYNGYGFPLECGKNGIVMGQWNSQTKGGHKVTWKVRTKGGLGLVINRDRSSFVFFLTFRLMKSLDTNVWSNMLVQSHVKVVLHRTHASMVDRFQNLYQSATEDNLEQSRKEELLLEHI